MLAKHEGWLSFVAIQIGVLHWFARLWEIDQDDYWGYITNCGTEGNLHGILVGRENLPDGILYASCESHYSVFKAARMYRMEAERVSHRVQGGAVKKKKARDLNSRRGRSCQHCNWLCVS